MSRDRGDLPPTFAELLERRLSRRGLLGAAATAGALIGLPRAARARDGGLGFERVPASTDDSVVVPPGYTWDLVASWGDALDPGVPAFDPAAQTPALQERRFGFNCDYVGYFPFPGEADRGLLWVNHEFPNGRMMFPSFDPRAPEPDQIDVQMAALGGSIVEVRREDGAWCVVRDSRFNRRVTATTEMELTGPAAGDALVRTAADPTGRRVLGTFNNCAGGNTPWGTVLTCEENVDDFFGGAVDPAHRRFGIRAGSSVYRWERAHERFDAGKHPCEPNRFGYVVEIDPFDPASTPKKRTALGRIKHEGATCGSTRDGHVAVYSGDDESFEYVYKFVTERRYDPADPSTGRDILDAGTLYVARFDEDGTGVWLPLVPRGRLAGWTPARIAVQTREAARILGATPMDRPEDIAIAPGTGHVYVVMTKNGGRRADAEDPERRPDAANPRSRNVDGHVVEIREADGDLGATTFAWDPFLLCGAPSTREDVYYAGAPVDEVDPLSCPDNLAVDADDHLWIATDGQPGSPQRTNDGVFVVPTTGEDRGRSRRFLTGPKGCEICGPEITPDGSTLFLAIQHPGGSSGLEDPSSTWPNTEVGIPLPSVIAVRREDGGRLGS